MLEFRPIAIEDKKEIERLMCMERYGTTESAFLDLYIWGGKFKTQVAFEDGFLFIRTGENAYLFPHGEGDLPRALDRIRADAQERGATPRLIGVTAQMKAKLEAALPGEFSFHETRDVFDYLYRAEDLISLSGKKLHQKRTNFNKFMLEYGDRYTFEEITEDMLSEVYEFQKRWLAARENEENAQDLMLEMSAIERALRHYSELEIRGGVIRIDGEIAAYSLGVPLCHRVYLVSIEKGDMRYAGIYQAINRLYAEHFCADFQYINREDDAGVPGLRRAKLSYQPAMLLEKYEVRWNDSSRGTC